MNNAPARPQAAGHDPSPDELTRLRSELERIRCELLAERRRAQSLSEALAASNARLDAMAAPAGDLQDEFLAVASHELKNPLNLIRLNAELLLRIPEASQVAAVARAAEMIRRTVMSQAQTIDDLRDMSRWRTGRLSLHRSPMDCVPTVRAIGEAMQPEAAGKRIILSVDLPAEPVTIDADAVRVEQIVWNLLTNAVKFTPAGGRIDLALRVVDDRAELEVRDTGRGIAPHVLPHVFDMFGQGEPGTSRRHGGMGIGLALVRNLAEAHGGQVEAASPGMDLGACFTVRLPLAGAPGAS